MLLRFFVRTTIQSLLSAILTRGPDDVITGLIRHSDRLDLSFTFNLHIQATFPEYCSPVAITIFSKGNPFSSFSIFPPNGRLKSVG